MINQKKAKELRSFCRRVATVFTVPKQEYTSFIDNILGRLPLPLTVKWDEGTYRRIYQDSKRRKGAYA